MPKRTSPPPAVSRRRGRARTWPPKALAAAAAFSRITTTNGSRALVKPAGRGNATSIVLTRAVRKFYLG